MKPQEAPLNTPWSLHFDRDGTEDIAIICDVDGENIVRSRHFWLPQRDDPIPPTLAAMQLMVSAPTLLACLITCANLLADYDDSDGSEGEAYREALEAILKATGRAA